MFKPIIITLAILVASVIDVLVDKALGINFSAISMPRRVTHNVVLKLTGFMIVAAMWLI